MKPLSGLDALFLHLETPETPMHVGALHLLAPPPGGARAYVARCAATWRDACICRPCSRAAWRRCRSRSPIRSGSTSTRSTSARTCVT